MFSSGIKDQKQLLDYAFTNFDKQEFEKFNKLMIALKDSDGIASYVSDLLDSDSQTQIASSLLNFDKGIDINNILEKIQDNPQSKTTLKEVFKRSSGRDFNEIAKEYIVKTYNKKDELLSLTDDKKQSKINYYLNTLLKNLEFETLQELLKDSEIQKNILNSNKKLTKKEEKKKSSSQRKEFFSEFINSKNLKEFDLKDLDPLRLAINLADLNLQIKLIDNIFKNDSVVSKLVEKKETEILAHLVKESPDLHSEIIKLEPDLSSILETDNRVILNSLELYSKKNMRESVKSFLQHFAVKLYGSELNKEELKELNKNIKLTFLNNKDLASKEDLILALRYFVKSETTPPTLNPKIREADNFK